MNLNVLGGFNGTSYGLSCLNFIKCLHKLGHTISFCPISAEPSAVQQNQELWNEINTNARMLDFQAPCLTIWHEFSLGLSLGRGKRLAMCFFESNKFDAQRKHHLENQDIIIVPSKWAAKVIKDNGIEVPTWVVPLGYDPEIFSAKQEWQRDEIRAKLGIRSDEFVFINQKKWEIRAGHGFLLDVFQATFPGQENVRLIMACHNHCLTDEENKKWADYYEQDPRTFVLKGRLETQTDLAKLYFISDAGVFPSLAEGWLLPANEMLGMQKPIITTRYSAPAEFVDGDLSYFVDVDELVPCYDGRFFYGVGNWAKYGAAQKNQLSQHMRNLYEKWTKGDNLVNNSTVPETYTWMKSTAKLVNNLKSVC